MVTKPHSEEWRLLFPRINSINEVATTHPRVRVVDDPPVDPGKGFLLAFNLYSRSYWPFQHLMAEFFALYLGLELRSLLAMPFIGLFR